MESYVERWAREQKAQKEEKKSQKEVITDGGTEEANGQTEGKQGQKAQKARRVRQKRKECGESKDE